MELSEGCGETLRVRVAGVVRGLFMLLRACRRARRREVCQGERRGRGKEAQRPTVLAGLPFRRAS